MILHKQLVTRDGQLDLLIPPGTQGAVVRAFQKMLNHCIQTGRIIYDEIAVDGIFGPQTQRAVQNINQNFTSGPFDDIMGLQTMRAVGMDPFFSMDASDHQYSIDFKALTKLGVWRFYYKLTEGFDYKSKRADRLVEATDAGMSVGGYHYGRPDLHSEVCDALVELDNYREEKERLTALGVKFRLPDAYDFEDGNKEDEDHNIDYFRRWAAGVDSPVLYTAKWAIDAFGNSRMNRVIEEFPGSQLWWAEYIRDHWMGGPQKVPALMTPPTMWQLTSSFTCNAVKRWNGEAARIDVNLHWDCHEESC